METGIHDYDRAAIARDNIPTLAEVMAAKPMRVIDGGGLVPAGMPIVSGDPDGDRDSAQAAELARLVKDMDGLADEVIFNGLDGMALVLATQWQAIRKITQSNQPASPEGA
jgi:hypothetical protein